MSEHLRTEVRGSILEVTIDKPKANAIDTALSVRMGEVFEAFKRNDELQVAILTGAGEKFFSAGMDLADPKASETADFGIGGFGGLLECFDLHKPVIAAINGYCLGGSLEFAMAADIMIASQNARFSFPEINVGMSPKAVSIQRLLHRLPRSIAMEMLLTGRRMDAEEARAVGFVSELVDAATLMSRARHLADLIVRAAPLAVLACKEAAVTCAHLPLEEISRRQYARALPWYARMEGSEDALEGPRSFVEKRSPVWKGR